MLERSLRILLFASLGLCLLPSCAHFTKSGRQQLAYAHYVKKMSHNRVRQTTKFKKVKMPKSETSEPRTSGSSGGPQSVSPSQAEPQSTGEARGEPQADPNASPE